MSSHSFLLLFLKKQAQHSFFTLSSPVIMKDIAHFLFGIFGNASALFLFLAPLITFRRIVKNKSTEKFSGVPYVMTLLNNFLSAWYGLPFVSPHNILVTTINGTGAVIETIYVLVFVIFAPKRERTKILGLLALILTVFAAVALISLLAVHGNPRKVFCGLAASIFSIVMYGSPLSVMRMVIRTKSVEFMPFFLSLFVFLCGTSWFIFGLLGRDPFIAVPNGVGSALGATQLILYVIYRDSKSSSNKDTKAIQFDDQDSLEMGAAKPHPTTQDAIITTQS